MARLNYTPTAEMPNEYGTIPEGTYPAVILKSEMRTAKTNPENSYLFLEWQIVSGPEGGRKVFQLIHAWNKNETAARIGRSQLNQICQALGHHGPLIDSEQLHGIRAELRVGIKPAENDYPEQNKVKAVKPFTPGASPSPPPSTAVPPAMSAPMPPPADEPYEDDIPF